MAAQFTESIQWKISPRRAVGKSKVRLSVCLSGNGSRREKARRFPGWRGIRGNGNGARKSHLQALAKLSTALWEIKAVPGRTAKSRHLIVARSAAGERTLVTARPVSIVIAEQRICRRVFYCTMEIGRRAAGRGIARARRTREIVP